MKKSSFELRSRKLARLANENIINETGRTRKNISFSGMLKNSSAYAICGEIHQNASYNGSGFSENLCYLGRLYDKYCDALVLATDNVLFDGAVGWTRDIGMLTDKPIIILDLFLTKEQILQAYQNGADAVIIIVAILENCEIKTLSDYAKTLGLDVIMEVQDEVELEQALKEYPSAICINTRDIENLAEVDMLRINRLRALIPGGVYVVAASGIKTNHDILRHCLGCHGVIVGSAILDSRNIKGALQYFQSRVDVLPFVWVRPATFLFSLRLKNLQHLLAEFGLELKYSFKVLNTPKVIAEMYKHKFREEPGEGRIYYSAMAEALNQVALRGGNPDYSEVWFLDYEKKTSQEVYELLLGIKAIMMEKESLRVSSIWIDGVDMPIELHSIHMPCHSEFDRSRELAILSAFRECSRSIEDYLR